MLGTEPLPDTDGEGLLVQALKQADMAVGQLVEQMNASNHAQGYCNHCYLGSWKRKLSKQGLCLG